MVADGRTVIAELWLRKRVERSGTGWSSRGPPGSGPRPLGRLGGGPLIHRTVFRCWVRPGGTNAASDEMRVASRPAAERTDKQTMPSCGGDCTLWAALAGQRVQALEQPSRRPEKAAVADGRYSRCLRRENGAA